MRVRIISEDRSKWYVAFYGTGTMVNVLPEKVGAFYELTKDEFDTAKREYPFKEGKVIKLFIPEKEVEVISG